MDDGRIAFYAKKIPLSENYAVSLLQVFEKEAVWDI